MKIAFIITCLGVGGAEKVVTSLADAFADQGHEILIVYLKGEALVRPSNSVVRLVGLNVTTGLDMAMGYIKLRKIIQKFRPDIIHSHMFHANMVARLLRLSIVIPKVVTTAHNRKEKNGRFRMAGYRFTDWLADISTNVSDEAVAAYIAQKAVKNGRMITVHNSISTQAYKSNKSSRNLIRGKLQIGEECKLICAVGRLFEPKDYPNLICAVRELSRSYPVQFKVCIAGDGPLKAELLNLVEEFSLEEHIQFLGVRDDIPALLSASDIYVLSSAWEGFPLVVGEAMACECVVVATDCGGVSEFLGPVGFLVPPEQPVALSEAMYRALNLTSEEKKRMGKAARKRVQELYSLEAAAEKWLKVYSGEYGV